MTTTPTDPAPRDGAAEVADEPRPGTDGALDPVAIASALRSALVAGDRPDPPGRLEASFTFGWRAVLKIRHVPEQLFDVTAFPIMFTLLFTYLFGGALAGSPQEYIQELLPGILVMTVAMITMYTGMSLNTDIRKGVFDRFRSMPVWRPSVLVGAMLSDTVRYGVAGVITVGLGFAIGFRPDGGISGVVAAIALLLVFAFSLSWVWASIGLVLRTPEAVMQVSMLVLFPLTFVSNVFVEPSTMPGWLEAVVEVNPITHLVSAARGLMHGDVEATQVGWVLLSCLGLLVIFAPLTMRLYNRER